MPRALKFHATCSARGGFPDRDAPPLDPCWAQACLGPGLPILGLDLFVLGFLAGLNIPVKPILFMSGPGRPPDINWPARES